MSSRIQRFESFHQTFLGQRFDSKLRSWVLFASLLGFAVHLLLWLIYGSGIFGYDNVDRSLLNSPLAALYTPFSILLAYEVYELIRAIPSSFSVAVGKQFEVVTLLIVRDIFKYLSLSDPTEMTEVSPQIGLIVTECFAFLFLYYVSLRFHQYGSISKPTSIKRSDIEMFVLYKKCIALLLLLIYIVIALFSFCGWLYFLSQGELVVSKEIFFLDFFTVLILADIFILLFSYKFSHDFNQLARNTGFILSTVILRVAIATEGFPAVTLFMLSGVLGLTILWVTNQFSGENR